MALDSHSIRQAAAIPIKGGKCCLVTSRSGKRWVVPKGNLEPGKVPSEIALQEAWEEAGLTGILQPDPVGSYIYEKLGCDHHVLVYVMRVIEVADAWPENACRQRSWFSLPQALLRIEDAGLRELIRGTSLPDKSTRRVRIS
jgi:8-oxo-dGTP pyrophosphatase MutT (NUDIX family)